MASWLAGLSSRMLGASATYWSDGQSTEPPVSSRRARRLTKKRARRKQARFWFLANRPRRTKSPLAGFLAVRDT